MSCRLAFRQKYPLEATNGKSSFAARARQIDNFLYKGAVPSAAFACGKTSGGAFVFGRSPSRVRARPGTSTSQSAPQAGHEFAECGAKQKVHRRERHIS